MTEQRSRSTTLSLPSDREIVMTRVFEAPRRLVFEAHSKPEHIQRWWGPRSSTMVVCDMDFRRGGRYRFVLREADGSEDAFRGEFREIVAPARIVQTFEWDGLLGHISVDTLTFEERDGKTTLTASSLFDSVEDRDGMIASGMEEGAIETWDRLAEYVSTVGGRYAMIPKAKDIDEYLAATPAEVRGTLQELREIIRAAAPQAEEVISYAIPTYRHYGPLVAFGAAKNHCGFYVMSDAVMSAYEDELKPYRQAKATVRFPTGKPVPAELVTKLVQARVAENEAARKK